MRFNASIHRQCAIRILNDSRFSDIVSPIRIGSEENIYDEEIRPYTLAAQKRQLKGALSLLQMKLKD